MVITFLVTSISRQLGTGFGDISPTEELGKAGNARRSAAAEFLPKWPRISVIVGSPTRFRSPAAQSSAKVDPVNTPTTSAASAHFASKLEFECDPSDVHADFDEGLPFVLVDSRGEAAWQQGRISGAIHLPTAEIPERAASVIPKDTAVVVYCWGPGCNGSTRAALAFSKLGYDVKEMIGGFEYWAREGYPTENDSGPVIREKDELTAPLGSITCAC